MTDGERLVWSVSFALVLDRAGDAVAAVRFAANAVEQLRAVAGKRQSEIASAIFQPEERELLDEIVSVP